MQTSHADRAAQPGVPVGARWGEGRTVDRSDSPELIHARPGNGAHGLVPMDLLGAEVAGIHHRRLLDVGGPAAEDMLPGGGRKPGTLVRVHRAASMWLGRADGARSRLVPLE